MHITKHFNEFDLERIWDDFNSRRHLTDATELLRNHRHLIWHLTISLLRAVDRRARIFSVVNSLEILHSASQSGFKRVFFSLSPSCARRLSREFANDFSLEHATSRRRDSSRSPGRSQHSQHSLRPCASDYDRIHHAWGLMRITRIVPSLSHRDDRLFSLSTYIISLVEERFLTPPDQDYY